MNSDLQKVHTIEVSFLHFEGAIKYIGGDPFQQIKTCQASKRKAKSEDFSKCKFRFYLLNDQQIYEGVNLLINSDLQKVHTIEVSFSGFGGAIEYMGGNYLTGKS